MKKRLIEPIGVAVVNRILHRAFGPSAAGTKVTLLRGGLFNTSYKVILRDGRKVVLRIAPSADKPLLGYEKGLLKRELRFLSALSAYGLAVARVIRKDFSGSVLPRDYVILEYVEGNNAFERWKTLTPLEQERVSAEWGSIVSKVHAFVNPQGWFGAPAPLKRHKRWSGFIEAYTCSLWEDLQKDPTLRRAAAGNLKKIAQKMRLMLDQVKVPRLVHGDLSLRNILITGKGRDCRITAILDWDRAVWGDPWFEWILHGIDLAPAFWQRYGRRLPQNGPAKKRILLYKACGCLHAALEDSRHFGKRAAALRMMGYYKINTDALERIL